MDIKWIDGILQKVTIKSLSGKACQIKYKEKTLMLFLEEGQSKTLTAEDFLSGK